MAPEKASSLSTKRVVPLDRHPEAATAPFGRKESAMDTGRLVPHPCGPRLLRGWLERHQHPLSFYLHLAGIPMTLLALPLLTRHQWRRAAGLFGGGYTLQFLGHLIEGNPPGEVLALQRRLARRQPGALTDIRGVCREAQAAAVSTDGTSDPTG